MKIKLNSQKSLGASLTEFVLGFPLLILLIMMLVDSGLYLFQRALLTDSTARLNRAVVTQLGQLEAEKAAFPTSPSVPCSRLSTIGTELATKIKNQKAILYQGMTFKLKLTETAPIPYRLITTSGKKPFVCLTCKFFPINLDIEHRSVLVIERPAYVGLTCNAAAWTAFATATPPWVIL